MGGGGRNLNEIEDRPEAKKEGQNSREGPLLVVASLNSTQLLILESRFLVCFEFPEF